MILLVSGATRTMRAIRHPLLGRLVSPGQGAPIDRTWAADNGAFSGFNEKAFGAMLRRREAHRSSCLWVAAPDVVGDARGTDALFAEWLPRLHPWPVAYVAQDGVSSVPWDSIAALFLGGTTGFKLGPDARAVALEAKRRGKLLHMGRVNTLRRIRYAFDLGCDSIDGSKFSMFSETYLRDALRYLTALENQVRLPGSWIA